MYICISSRRHNDTARVRVPVMKCLNVTLEIYWRCSHMTLGHLGRACARRGRCYYGLFTCGEILVRLCFVLRDATPPLPLGLALLCYLVQSSVSPPLGAPFCHFLTFRAVSSSKNVLRFISSNIHRTKTQALQDLLSSKLVGYAHTIIWWLLFF